MRKLIPFLFLIPLIWSGCYYDNLEEISLANKTGNDSCIVPDTVSYAADIQPILNSRCGSGDATCHVLLAETLLRSGQFHEGWREYAWRTRVERIKDATLRAMQTHGVRVLVDPKSLAYIDGTELDFVREGLNEGFRFNNPNERDRCGCGESFRV